MRREEMVERAAKVLAACDGGNALDKTKARAMLDAILPQVTTVAELDALAVGSIVTDGDGGVWRRDADRWWDRPDSVACLNSAALHDDAAPLTVVWQPEAVAP